MSFELTSVRRIHIFIRLLLLKHAFIYQWIIIVLRSMYVRCFSRVHLGGKTAALKFYLVDVLTFDFGGFQCLFGKQARFCPCVDYRNRYSVQNLKYRNSFGEWMLNFRTLLLSMIVRFSTPLVFHPLKRGRIER